MNKRLLPWILAILGWALFLYFVTKGHQHSRPGATDERLLATVVYECGYKDAGLDLSKSAVQEPKKRNRNICVEGVVNAYEGWNGR